jgi:hypothetical protein
VRALVLVAALLIPTMAFGPAADPAVAERRAGLREPQDIPEQAADYWLKSVNNPSITAYLPPKDLANGAALVVLPGGGHRLLVIHSEGDDVAKVMNPRAWRSSS